MNGISVRSVFSVLYVLMIPFVVDKDPVTVNKSVFCCCVHRWGNVIER